jgi:hypothetical protein
VLQAHGEPLDQWSNPELIMRLKAYFVVPQPQLDMGHGDFEQLQSDMLQELREALPGMNLETDLGVLQVAHTRIAQRMRTSHAEALRRWVDYRPNRILEISLVAGAERASSANAHWPSAQLLAEKRLHEILIAANIASPGSLEVTAGLLIARDREWRIPKPIEPFFLRDAFEVIREVGWPILRKVGIRTVLKWLRHFDGFTSGFSNSPISRALNAVTHSLDGRNDPLICLMWSMVGIEALYNRRGEPVMEQLREKCVVFLGRPPAGAAIRKIFRDMYGFRSSFIHGGSDFEGVQCLSDDDTAIDKHHVAVWEATRLALGILVASLQKLAQRDMTSLEFDYAIRA